MKKIISFILLLFCTVSLASCREKPDTPTPQETYTVTFNTMGGSTIAAITTDADGFVSKPTDPKKDYYVFDNWYLTEDCTGTPWSFSTKVIEDITLYAKWNEIGIMTYQMFMEAESGDFVRIQGYISNRQSFYNGAATVYLTESKKEGYFIYNMPMTEEEYNTKYTVGTYIEIKATKTIFSGEHEIMGENIADLKVVENSYSMDQIAVDVSDDVSAAATSKVQNAYFTASLKIKAYTTTDLNATVAESGAYGYKGDTPNDDLYFILEDKNGNELSCCVEVYLTGTTTNVYQMVLSNDFVVGAYVKVTGYMYFYDNKPNPHITSIVLTDDDLAYETFRAAENGDDVTAKGLLYAKTTYYNGSTNLYVLDADDYGNSEGYYIYDYKCTQEEYNALPCYYSQTAPQDLKYVTITGKKSTYANFEEIIDAEVTATAATHDYINKVLKSAVDTKDITLSGSTLDVYQSALLTSTYTVKEYTTTDQNTHVSDSKAYGYKGDTPTDDIYLRLEDGAGNVIDFCLEAYVLYPTLSDGSNGRTFILDIIEDLKVNDEITIVAFAYWWYGPNLHIFDITAN